MKKLLIILQVLFLSLALSAQQTEDEIYIGKGKTFGNYKGTGIIIPDVGKTAKQIDVQTIFMGPIVGICKKDCCNNKRTSCSVDVKKDDGSIVTIGTRDSGFTVPKEIAGKTIIVEGKDVGQISGGRKRRDVQPGIQFAATGILVMD
jgi:hypothetical protein